MPIIKSAKKRVKTAQSAAVRNSKTKRALKAAIKDFDKSLVGGKSKASSAHASAQSAVAKAGKKHVIHKNKVARKQRQLAAAAKAAGINLAAKKSSPATSTKKTSAKPTPAKKPTTKKPVAKKTPVKKS